MATLAPPIEYFPAFITDAAATYEALLTLPWQRRKALYGHMVPRDEVWLSPYSYRYGGRLYAAYDGWTRELLAIKEQVEAHTGIRFNSVLCNLYRTGDDWVVYHCDCEPTMSKEHPIASISLGVEREFQMRLKSDHKVKEKMTLASGSLVVMNAGMQQEWEHQVPKCETKGGRINLTFRVMTGDMR